MKIIKINSKSVYFVQAQDRVVQLQADTYRRYIQNNLNSRNSSRRINLYIPPVGIRTLKNQPMRCAMVVCGDSDPLSSLQARLTYYYVNELF